MTIWQMLFVSQDMIFLHAVSNIEDGEEIDIDDIVAVMEWVNESGGLKEFDYTV